MQALTLIFAEKRYMAYVHINIVSAKINQGL